MTRKRIWLAVQLLFIGAAVWYFGRAIAGEWGDLESLPSTLRPDWWILLESAGCVLLSYVVLIETWRQIVIAWGGRLSWGTAARIWFISNLGRFIPALQIGAMGALAEEAGVSGVAAMGSSLFVNLVNLLAGCLVVAVAGSRKFVGEGPAFTVALVVFCVAVIASPWLLPPVVRLAARIVRRDIPVPAIPPLAMLFAVAGCSLAWNLYGVAFRDLAVALFGDAAGKTSYYTAVFAVSYLAGYIAPFAPGGLGVRETSLLALLAVAGLETGTKAAALIILSRLMLTVLESAPGLILLAVRRPKALKSTTEKNGP
jgi:uncharacterized membrane protein YbhN (UPF0104 family)